MANFYIDLPFINTVTITGPVTIAGSIAVSNFPPIQVVDVDNFPLVQDVNPLPAGSETISSFSDALAVAQSATVTVLTYSPPSGKTGYLQSINCAGQNIGVFEIYINSVIFDRKYSYYTELNVDFVYSFSSSLGFVLTSADTLTIKVTNSSTSSGNYNTRMQSVEV